jgi:glutamyl-Q tRNA(Asp) synthetase
MFATRFAPSPTGYLHLGHAFSALSAYDASIRADGRFILRIEDIDTTRCKPEYEAAILEDLAWLGLTWPTPVRRQSDHIHDYVADLNSLVEKGLVYRCFKTRQELQNDIGRAPHGPISDIGQMRAPLNEKDEARLLEAGKPFAWRLSVLKCRAFLKRSKPDADVLSCIVDNQQTLVDWQKINDAVIARKEFPTSYHIACVSDDARQGVTHVIRGADLADVIPLHVVLQAVMGLLTPIYQHHSLILGEDGKRLAKRDQSITLRAMRQAGATPDDIRSRVGLAKPI